MRAFFVLALAVAWSGCSSSDTPTATLVLLPGQETDAFTRDPRPERLDINLISESGTRAAASMPWPSSSFDVGDLPATDFAAFEAVGRNAAGDAIVRGRTLPMLMGALDGAQVPLFMGRVGEMARPPGALPASRSQGVAGVIDDELVVLTGGTGAVDASGAPLAQASATAYDLGLWAPLAATPILARAAASMAIVSRRYGLLIDSSGATWVDFDSSAEAEASAPGGLSFADVAGATTVMGDDGSAWLVGATRAGSATAAVLRVTPELTLGAYALSAARAGAAAAWVSGRGLVVIGGSAQAAGVEVLAPGGSSFVTLPFEPDGSQGAGAAALDANRVLLAGGLDELGVASGARTLDLGCSSACVPQMLADTQRTGLARASAWAMSPSRAIVFGTAPAADSDAGQNRVALIQMQGAGAQVTEVPLREPRVGATALALPIGMIAVAGGMSPDGQPVRSLELFIPPE